ncbi:hypothetical protein [Haloferula helveola]|uniref:hypothetical protein n=1 Tax=Haloferula helveola TaxID=490095 RepID=UPI0030D2A580
MRLRVWFSADNTTVNLLSPDGQITASGYALSAEKAQSVTDGAITEAMLADGLGGGNPAPRRCRCGR